MDIFQEDENDRADLLNKLTLQACRLKFHCNWLAIS